MLSSDGTRISARRAIHRGLAAIGLTLLLVPLGLALAPRPAVARSGEARLSIDVPAGQWKGVRLKNIPAGAVLGVQVDSDGPVAVLLLRAADLTRFPAPERPVFEGRTDDRLSISVLAPETGDYYVLVDNREGAEARSVALTLKGESDRAGAAGSAAGAP